MNRGIGTFSNEKKTITFLENRKITRLQAKRVHFAYRERKKHPAKPEIRLSQIPQLEIVTCCQISVNNFSDVAF